jgi:hypothetical protein
MKNPSKFLEAQEVEMPAARFGFDQSIPGHGHGIRESLIRSKRFKERRKEGFEKADEIIKKLEGSYRRSAELLKALR